jgi:hypothetical protein
LKVCHTRQRPIAQTTSGIGVWENVLQIMSVLAIITNVVLLGIVSTHLPRVFSGSRMRFVILLIALEHTVLFFKYWLTSAVSRVPLALQRALACEDGSLDEIPSSVVAGTGYLTPAEVKHFLTIIFEIFSHPSGQHQTSSWMHILCSIQLLAESPWYRTLQPKDL